MDIIRTSVRSTPHSKRGSCVNRAPFVPGRLKSVFCLVSFLLLALPMTGCRQADPEPNDLRVPSMVLTLDNVGAIQQIGFTGRDQTRQVRAFTRLRDCEPEGSVEVARSDSQLSFQRRWISKSHGQFGPGDRPVQSGQRQRAVGGGGCRTRRALEHSDRNASGLSRQRFGEILDCLGRPEAGRHTQPIPGTTGLPWHTSIGCHRELERSAPPYPFRERHHLVRRASLYLRESTDRVHPVPGKSAGDTAGHHLRRARGHGAEPDPFTGRYPVRLEPQGALFG